MKLICSRLAGGLGNQLFQFAAAVHLSQSKKLNFSSICIDARFLGNYEVKRTYEIGFISDLFPGVSINQRITPAVSLASRLRLARVLNRRLCSYNFISSSSYLKHVCLHDDHANSYILDGYFQHPDVLFSEADRNEIREKLNVQHNNLISNIHRGARSIGVHIRRGDYVKSKAAAKIFRNIPLDYYNAALHRLGGDYKIMVFSDDREVSRYYARQVNGIDVGSYDLSLKEEFCLLMSCDEHVIANSTFSWWAAYLGQKTGSRVIAPKIWYHDYHRSHANPLLLPSFDLIDE